ncbi:MAG TPA: hypothetical protein VKA67_10255, partial [Verrucomicrobiae bacterium]|nr:hypothetical protein [Verrucomicrobiae bacterium]
MRSLILRIAAIAFVIPALVPALAHAQAKEKPSSKSTTAKTEIFKPQQKETTGSVTIGGQVIHYNAYAGTLVVHAKKNDDDAENAGKGRQPEA